MISVASTPLDLDARLARFRDDVSKHTVRVLRDDGLYRHLRCSDGTFNMRFDVITWPGHMAYAGDMGCFVFARLDDMFEFFRGRLRADPGFGYLAEKAIAGDKTDGIREYSAELFEAAVKSDFETHVAGWSDEDRTALWDDIEAFVLSASGDGLEAALSAATAFEWNRRSVFQDFWERQLEDFTGRFRWCCYAIPWAIEQYDILTAGKGAPA